MPTQSEQTLENNLISQLKSLGYSYVQITDEKALTANLKTQLEKHNNITLTDNEFEQVLNHLNKGNVFERAKILRDEMHLLRDDGTSVYLEFINQKKWCQNEYQVTSQVTVKGTYKNRYDVTILVNGLPLVQIELKRRGLELKEAFNQINRYHRHSFGASHALFQYIQIFVISNGVNTKYYANNRKQSFKQTFFWADKKNKNITKLKEFTCVFLEPCHLSKMITKYVVLAETDKILMVLRPYQYYATEAIIERVKTSDKNGYIWHTTGSGKTLTSFKASQIMTELPEVYKVVFVVDRKDLDTQTIKEFNSFSKGSVDGTDNTKKLVKQFEDDTKLIVTTIQKLNSAISKNRYLEKMEKLKNKKVVFIFDECHRSQFGETHKRIKKFFNKNQMFGFTGTPIFADNAFGSGGKKQTTKDLFCEQLHNYVITDAISDENVLRFSVEYYGKYKIKDSNKYCRDIEVEGIDTKELMESEKRIEEIVDYIIDNHDRKTRAREFTAMFCVSSIDTLIKYYEIFKKKKDAKEHNLKIATIFSYTANEDDKDANGLLEEDVLNIAEGAKVNKHSRDKLDEFIEDYNKMYSTKFSTKDTQSFYNYYKDIADKVKKRKVDILLVVNMFLTGFDSPSLNTMYVDKNLKYHGLVQAYSRTNRILNEQKSQGNIVCFRNLKKATDQAIALFSNKNAKEIILMEPYEEYVQKFNQSFAVLLGIVPTVESVDNLKDENDELNFVKAFRELMRLKNILESFVDFNFKDLAISEQSYEDYKSKYLDIHDKIRTNEDKEKVSILDDVDFELELIHRDKINVAYILQLLADLVGVPESKKEERKKAIFDIISGESHLRKKRELIEQFINENLPHIKDSAEVSDAFDSFLTDEKLKAFDKLVKEEDLEQKDLEEVIERYLFSGKVPLREDVAKTLKKKPKILERKKIVDRLKSKILKFFEIFIEGV